MSYELYKSKKNQPLIVKDNKEEMYTLCDHDSVYVLLWHEKVMTHVTAWKKSQNNNFTQISLDSTFMSGLPSLVKNNERYTQCGESELARLLLQAGY